MMIAMMQPEMVPVTGTVKAVSMRMEHRRVLGNTYE